MRRIVLFLICLLACPAYADDDVMRFDVRLLGAKIGVLTISANQSTAKYAARSNFSTAGLVGALKTMNADVAVNGQVKQGNLVPARYSEAINDGTRVTNVKVQFSPGTPKLLSGDTGSKAAPAKPSELKGAIDPLTGLILLLRDQPQETACKFSSGIFDGHRLARIQMTKAQAKGDTLVCHGSYQRVSGYTNSERKSRKVPITIEYVPSGGVLQARVVRVETRYGKAVVKRR